ncbi:TniQ family protein [Streptomyces sp. NBC_00878]|uniref:TniQ family protein n=1 Tax=Streptomyces sp. NBC_00878 TaxID=2975854 RepID=UPI002257417C|nr:TniQ family protein [Streptomyces sp. NBC_00878]MCX4907442.1 TniQ family protein [Streptomyces sp. NBC_00878]
MELRFCPACVDERRGRRPLDWSTPWAFACLRHGRCLLAACSTWREPVRAGGVGLGHDRCRVSSGMPRTGSRSDAAPSSGMW